MIQSTNSAIAILEDNVERWHAMQACLAERLTSFEIVWRRSAPEMIEWLQSNLHRTIAITLDHDLEPMEDGPQDPGTVRDVSDWLCTQQPCAPIVIHSTNVPAAHAMEAELTEAGWRVDRITPYEDLLWVREAWLVLFCQMIREYGNANSTK